MRSLNPWPIFPSNLEPPVARSLSIQFILQGLIDSFLLLKDLHHETLDKIHKYNLQDGIAHVSKKLEKFLLFSLENPFMQKSSTLDKLCFYSEILLQASHIRDNEVLVILEKMRNDILKVRSKMISWKKMSVTFEEVRTEFLELFANIYYQLRQFFHAFSPFLKEARFDENVLIYLVENKAKLNSNLGEKWVDDLLKSFFPAGHGQLRTAIFEGFTRRGFTTFLSSIEPLIDAIEWETPCHLPAKH